MLWSKLIKKKKKKIKSSVEKRAKDDSRTTLNVYCVLMVVYLLSGHSMAEVLTNVFIKLFLVIYQLRLDEIHSLINPHMFDLLRL